MIFVVECRQSPEAWGPDAPTPARAVASMLLNVIMNYVDKLHRALGGFFLERRKQLKLDMRFVTWNVRCHCRSRFFEYGIRRISN
jgi:hypothetical protein